MRLWWKNTKRFLPHIFVRSHLHKGLLDNVAGPARTLASKGDATGESSTSANGVGVTGTDGRAELTARAASGHVVLKDSRAGSARESPSARESAVRAGARDVAHWCEALARAQPSPFLPLHVPRQRASAGREEGQAKQVSAADRPPQSFFRRPLADLTVAYSSERGRAMLNDVMQTSQGGAAFLDIITAFEMQRQPISCGLASLTIALNVLKLAPWRQERGVGSGQAAAVDEQCVDEQEFEMVTEAELSRVLLEEHEHKHLQQDGVSLDALAKIARRVSGIEVQCVHAGTVSGQARGCTEAQFRQAIKYPTLPPHFIMCVFQQLDLRAIGSAGRASSCLSSA